MKIAIGCDHGGYNLKSACIDAVQSLGHQIVDFGTDNGQISVDYPDYSYKVAKAVVDGTADKGILLCGTGIGIAIAANKVKGIRCACVADTFCAKMTAEHNNANIIAMGGRVVDQQKAKDIVTIFLTTPFEGGRHQQRIDKITEIENNQF